MPGEGWACFAGFCCTGSKMLQIKSQTGVAAAQTGSEVVCSGSLACKCREKGEGAISPSADPNRCGGGVRDAAPSLAWAHSSQPNAARPAEPCETRWGGRKLPPDFVLRLKENTLEQRPSRAWGGDCGGNAGFGRGLRHLGGLPSLASLGQRQPERTLPALPPTRPLIPGGGNCLDFKGDQSREGTSHPGTTFLPLRPSCQLFCFGY